jgi:hypothetical protein
MPEPTAILEGLGRIVERFGWLAIAWHVVLAAAFILLLAGLRPSRRLGALLLTLPLVSVAVLAFTNGNPFNGIVFAAFAVVLSAIGVSLPAEKSRSVEGWALGVGIVLILFGFFYPHFLGGYPWTRYLYAAPAGLIPCPSLCVVTGFVMITAGFGSWAYSLLVAALGLFYGPFGAFRLGVAIDIVLMLGAISLLVQTVCVRRSAGSMIRPPQNPEPPGP